MNIAAAINLHSVATAVSGFCIPVFLRSQHKNVRGARAHIPWSPGGLKWFVAVQIDWSRILHTQTQVNVNIMVVEMTPK